MYEQEIMFPGKPICGWTDCLPTCYTGKVIIHPLSFKLGKNTLFHLHNGQLEAGSSILSFRREGATSPLAEWQWGEHNPTGSSFTLGWQGYGGSRAQDQTMLRSSHWMNAACPRNLIQACSCKLEVERTVPTASYKSWNSILASLNIEKKLTTGKMHYDPAIKFIGMLFFFFS